MNISLTPKGQNPPSEVASSVTVIAGNIFEQVFLTHGNCLGLDNCSLRAAALFTVGYLSAPLASDHKARITPPSNFDNKTRSPDLTKCLQIFLNHLWLRTTLTGIFATLIGIFRHNTSYFGEKPLFSLPELSYSILSHHLSVYLFSSCILKTILRVYF